jgi:cysteinyl-tRNA synthetase
LDLLKADNIKMEAADEDLINKLIAERKEARDNKDWSKADEIRDKLKNMGVDILDSKDGTTWKARK